MLNSLKKVLLLSVVLFLFLGVGSASASSKGKSDGSGSRPKIEKVESHDRYSALLNFKYKKDKGEKVSVKVKVYNDKTGSIETRKFKKVKLDSNGKAKIRVDGLKMGVKYSFKLKVKGPCDCEYSCNSKCNSVVVDP